MGKASRWIRNLLMGGKREDKAKAFPPETCTSTSLGIMVVATPKVRRRWSFKRPPGPKPVTHKSSKSFDSIYMPKQDLLALPMTPPTLNAHAAATRIQATYRSYLARRALRALRGLVKLQGLARGYLVRKQMNTVLRSIHAVMAIQVRARIQRIQMGEDQPPLVVGRRNSYTGPSSASDRQLGKLISENAGDGNILATSRGLRSRSGRVPAERVEYGSRVYSSGRLSVSQREYQLKMSPSPSTLSFTDSSSTTCDGQLEEFSLKMARRNSRRYSASPENKHPFIIPSSQSQDYMPSNSTMFPNYMTNTKSSQAKARSHSEPRQRPKQKGKRSSSMDGKNDKQNEYPWLCKLYRSDKSTDEGDCDSSIGAMAVISKHMQSLVPFEGPPMNLY
ncbi:protein IQ-DOMAIN 19-like isoform X2 [Salvia miltiorrhiza]|uniref:protein IQ-DOMAIN 19-like isoform X2 n=1 Tax=Salvia miltiorrhiza TaxID=226208 RepID=UPI0025AC62FE|nr:protein IQ-DOMAIN 19-like isoform X2 [Salvia miltiorrhiza]